MPGERFYEEEETAPEERLISAECNRLSGQMQPSVWAEARLFTPQSNDLEGMKSRGKSRKASDSGIPGDKDTKKEEALRASSSTAF